MFLNKRSYRMRHSVSFPTSKLEQNNPHFICNSLNIMYDTFWWRLHTYLPFGHLNHQFWVGFNNQSTISFLSTKLQCLPNGSRPCHHSRGRLQFPCPFCNHQQTNKIMEHPPHSPTHLFTTPSSITIEFKCLNYGLCYPSRTPTIFTIVLLFTVLLPLSATFSLSQNPTTWFLHNSEAFTGWQLLKIMAFLHF